MSNETSTRRARLKLTHSSPDSVVDYYNHRSEGLVQIDRGVKYHEVDLCHCSDTINRDSKRHNKLCEYCCRYCCERFLTKPRKWRGAIISYSWTLWSWTIISVTINRHSLEENTGPDYASWYYDSSEEYLMMPTLTHDASDGLTALWNGYGGKAIYLVPIDQPISSSDYSHWC